MLISWLLKANHQLREFCCNCAIKHGKQRLEMRDDSVRGASQPVVLETENHTLELTKDPKLCTDSV